MLHQCGILLMGSVKTLLSLSPSLFPFHLLSFLWLTQNDPLILGFFLCSQFMRFSESVYNPPENIPQLQLSSTNSPASLFTFTLSLSFFFSFWKDVPQQASLLTGIKTNSESWPPVSDALKNLQKSLENKVSASQLDMKARWCVSTQNTRVNKTIHT